MIYTANSKQNPFHVAEAAEILHGYVTAQKCHFWHELNRNECY